MELKMKAICESRTTKSAVIHEMVEQYRATYTRTVQGMNLLQAVSHSGQSHCNNTSMLTSSESPSVDMCKACHAETSTPVNLQI